jgi:CMP-N,N'-diacetyllegionaminic acid synthase
MRVLGVIPARGGSKSIPYKNLADVAGRPLISYVIEAARTASRIDRLIVSTDDEEIAAAAKAWGAEVPFIRPRNLAGDTVSLVPVIAHALHAIDELGFAADAVLSAQPTSPFLEGRDFDSMVEKLEVTDADSVASVQAIEHGHPFWVKRLEGDRVCPFNEYTNESFLQRQDLPPAYIYDGALFLRKRHVLESWAGKDFCLGADVRALVLGGAKSLHIDDPLDLEVVRVVAAQRATRSPTGDD